MKEITYTITDELGIHARPAGQLIKVAKEFKSNIQIEFKEKLVDAKRIFGVMGLAVKQGEEIKVIIEGEDEEIASLKIQEFLKANM